MFNAISTVSTAAMNRTSVAGATDPTPMTPARPASSRDQDSYTLASHPQAIQMCQAGGNSDRPLPTQAEALKDIKQNAMPRVLEGMKRDGESNNKSNCDVGAGRMLAELRSRGYQAELNQSAGHVTVRVKTQGEDIIVDPTAAQFFKDGTAIDSTLQKKGFVGTREQLRETYVNHAEDLTAAQNVPTRDKLRADNPGYPAGDIQFLQKDAAGLNFDLHYTPDTRSTALRDSATDNCQLSVLRALNNR
ncbi:MAG: hypothetical protein ABIJ09_25850 [Pseudomonadota bacterium]